IGLAPCSNVTFLLAFEVIRESSPLVFELLSIAARHPCHLHAAGPDRGKSGPAATITVRLFQKRKTIPAEGWAVCVVVPECSAARSKSTPVDETTVFGAK